LQGGEGKRLAETINQRKEGQDVQPEKAGNGTEKR